MRAALALAAFVLAGCTADPFSSGDPADLHAAARSLVPPGARIASEKESACLELRDFPSCVIIRLEIVDSSRRDRLEAVIDAAEAAGWTQTHGDSASGGSMRSYERGSYTAQVFIRAHEYFWQRHCEKKTLTREDLLDDCADHVMVEVQ